MKASEDYDLELIAAFIDSRLTGIERDRAVKALTESSAALQIYADAVNTCADVFDGGS
jgi:hypothetical protein